MTRWTDGFLDSMRLVGDRACDSIVEQVFENEQADVVNAMLVHLDHNSDLVPSEMPASVREFLLCQDADPKGEPLPKWADHELMSLGQRFFSRYAPQIVMALHCSSLPECYAAAKGVQVLGVTQRIYKHTYRRIMETAQFVLDVMAQGGMGPSGHGVRSAQKVRLLHSTIRYHLHGKNHLPKDLGVPINQEDLLGTLMSFSVCVLQALQKLGIEADAADREGYLHTWKVVGYVLGIDSKILPVDYADAETLTETIRRRHFAASEVGRDLTKALIEYMQYMVPGNLFDGFPAVLMHHFLGDEVSAMLGIPAPDWTQAFVHPYKLFIGGSSAISGSVAGLNKLTEIIGRKTLEAMYYIIRGGERYQIRIPKEVCEQWGIRSE